MHVLELLAAYHALQIYCKNMFDTSVHLKVDNTTAVAWIKKQTAPTELKFQLRNKFGTLQHRETYASYTESKKNKIAEFESRNVKDNLEWALKDHMSVVFLDCPKMYFQDFQKIHSFRYFLQILKFRRKNFGQVVIMS